MALRILTIDAKCSDMCSFALTINGKIVKDGDGYAPRLLPNGGGDYVNLVIDMDSGQILNWKVPTEKQVENFIGE
jgi:hypothetical protein